MGVEVREMSRAAVKSPSKAELSRRLKLLKDLALDMCGAYGQDCNSLRAEVRLSYKLLRKQARLK